MSEELLVGASEVEITPPVGTALAGALQPRTSVGVQDPLYAKAIVLESGGQRLAYVILDLVKLLRAEGDRAAALACERTGIAPDRIVWAVSHTHTGPYAGPMFGGGREVVNEAWLAALPEKIAECVARADASKTPCRMSRRRAFAPELAANRRILFKDGRALNAWTLASAPKELQCLGTAGPIDPEVGILSFDDAKGRPIAVLFQYALHTNTNFGNRFSADYPGVVASRLRERFGPGLVTLFVPGACADLNRPAGMTCRGVGDALAEHILAAMDGRVPHDGPVALDAMKREVVVPFRDLTQDQSERIAKSGWPAGQQDVFRREMDILRAEGKTEARTVLQAWRIGEVGFASLPGELFVEWGIKIKRESPFPWTYPVELGGDYLGYLITPDAWAAGGYEALIARSALPSHQGVALMVDQSLDMLRQLHSGKKRS